MGSVMVKSWNDWVDSPKYEYSEVTYKTASHLKDPTSQQKGGLFKVLPLDHIAIRWRIWTRGTPMKTQSECLLEIFCTSSGSYCHAYSDLSAHRSADKSDWTGRSKTRPLKDSDSNTMWGSGTVVSDDYEDNFPALDLNKRLPKRKNQNKILGLTLLLTASLSWSWSKW